MDTEVKEKEYNVYIDESGDEGIKRGLKFFILTAIVVDKSNEDKIKNTIYDIKLNLEISKTTQLHWNKITGTPNKKYVIDTINNEDFTIIHTIIDTSSIKYLKPNQIYFNFFNYLLERIALKTKDGIINKIYISSRSGLSTQKLKDNFKNSYDNIDTTKIKDIVVKQNKYFALLQLADVCCSSFQQALRYPSKLSYYCVLKLKNKLFKNPNGIIKGFGIKLIPNGGDFKEVDKLNVYN
jgi:hypothetical protein